MGVVVLAAIVSLALANAIAVALYFFFFWRKHPRPESDLYFVRKNRRTRYNLYAVVVVAAFFGLLVPLTKFFWSLTVRQGTNVPISETWVLGPKLPIQVGNMTYYTDYGVTEAVFTLTEGQLTEWAKQEDWPIEPINFTYSVRLNHLNVDLKIQNGLRIEKGFHPRGTSVYIVFDRDTGTCYYRYAGY